MYKLVETLSNPFIGISKIMNIEYYVLKDLDNKKKART